MRLLHGRTWEREREHERERQQEKKGKGRRGASVPVLLVAASRTARRGRRQGAREAQDLEKGHGMEELGRVLLSLDQTREAAGALGVEVGDGLVRWGKRGKERGWLRAWIPRKRIWWSGGGEDCWIGQDRLGFECINRKGG